MQSKEEGKGDLLRRVSLAQSFSVEAFPLCAVLVFLFLCLCCCGCDRSDFRHTCLLSTGPDDRTEVMATLRRGARNTDC